MLITECCIASAGSSGLGTKTYWLVKSRRRNQSVLSRAVSIRLEISGGQPDFVLYDLAIDRKLRVCDRVELRLDEIQNAGTLRSCDCYPAKNWTTRAI